MKDMDIIKDIESLLQIQLKSAQKNSDDTNSYTLQNDQIIALRISENQMVKENLEQLVMLLKQLENLETLQITRCNIDTISLQGLKQLTELDLSETQICIITPLQELKHLTSLNLSCTQVSDITPLQGLKQLTKLNLMGNQISDIAPLQKLKQLTELNLMANQIIDITPLQELKQLTSLILCYTQVNDITSLQVLKQLTELSLRNTQISDITTLQELKLLTILDLSSTQISNITPLLELKQLTNLYLNSNQITDVTPLQGLKQLTKLDLRNNQLKTLPWELVKHFKNIILDSLSPFLDKDGLYLTNNPITEPPISILELGYQAVKDYFEQKDKYGVETSHEGKILIIGEAGAGKSTLFLKLANPELKLPDTQSTLGIIIKEGLHLQHPNKSKEEMIANLWDFGGQEIQYNLHQYFITPDALYILVSDNRKQNTQWNYWFHIIELLAGKGTVLVILNNNATNSSKSDFEITKYEKWFPNLKIVQCDVDFAKNDIKWEYLQSEVNRLFAELPSANEQVPKPWIELRNELLRKRDECHYISLNEFYQLTTHNNITREEKKTALKYFTKVGIVTYFSEDEKMNNVIFLKPNWITQGLYAAIDSGNKDLDNGQFTKKWIYDFWSKHENKYNEDEQSYLLLLMLKDKFDICYELENERNTYVIPFLLPAKQPDFQWVNEDNIGLRIQYSFMPKAMLSRLIVQLSGKIELNKETNKQLVWSDGVILKDVEIGSRAKIICEYDSRSDLKYIDIRISGISSKSKEKLLQLIRYKLEEIHRKSFKGINFTELILCNCDVCKTYSKPYYFEKEYIDNYLKKGKKQIECRNLAEPVNIDQLIGPVYSEEEIDKRILQWEEKKSPKSRRVNDPPDTLFTLKYKIKIIAILIVIIIIVCPLLIWFYKYALNLIGIELDSVQSIISVILNSLIVAIPTILMSKGKN